MKVHGNAALGPAGRLALVQAIESGMTHRRQPTAGGTVGAKRARRIAGTAAGFATAPRAPTTSHGGSRRQRKSRSCAPAGRPVWAPAAWRGSAAGHARRSGRCSGVTVSPGADAQGERATVAMSGRARVPSCMSTSLAWPASSDPGTRSPGARQDRRREAGVLGLRLSALRDRRSLPLRLRRAAPRSKWKYRGRRLETRDRALHRPRHETTRGGDERQRPGLSALQRVSGRARATRRPPHPDSALHTTLEREGREVHPNLKERVGLRPHLADLSRAGAFDAILPALLQPAQATQLSWGPTADQPRSQRLWVGQLVAQMERDAGGSAGIHEYAEALDVQGLRIVELAGLEPATSWVRSKPAAEPKMPICRGLKSDLGARVASDTCG
jgi:hypothetical protein